MEISEGDTVVTPEGDSYKVSKTWGISPSHIRGFHVDELIKTADPLRVRVDHEADAQALISRAEEAGLEFHKDVLQRGIYQFNPENMTVSRIAREDGHDLAYPSDSDQIIGWLDFHAENECDRCSGEGEIWANSKNPPVDNWKIPCPDCSEDQTCPICNGKGFRDAGSIRNYEAGKECGNCGGTGVVSTSDDDQRWESPDPSDPAWRDLFRRACESGPEKWLDRMDRLGIDLEETTTPLLLDWIDRFDDAASYWKEQFHDQDETVEELKVVIDDLEAERDELRGRIQEAKKSIIDEANETFIETGPNSRGKPIDVMQEAYQILDGEGESQ